MINIIYMIYDINVYGVSSFDCTETLSLAVPPPIFTMDTLLPAIKHCLSYIDLRPGEIHPRSVGELLSIAAGLNSSLKT